MALPPRRLSFKEYYWAVTVKAWSASLSSVLDRSPVVIVVPALGFLIDMFMRGLPKAFGEGVVLVLWTVIATAAVLVAMFCRNFVLVPVR